MGLAFFGDRAEVSFLGDSALPLGEQLPDLWTDAVEQLGRSLAPPD
ncbi:MULTISPECIES: hypothetical protein [unclassified Streptomyces]